MRHAELLKPVISNSYSNNLSSIFSKSKVNSVLVHSIKVSTDVML